ncbi:MAG: aminotransferase class I/II-fold pyridoxal phosphate-dependent enzyme, partial [Oscillospiraceae bacterium]|nr:aminotransferase class I/II-fold pyridoxal phosphate-dependent enzyme [Oscillospiraceae bacterium]
DLAAYDKNRLTLYEALTSYGYECVKPMGAFYMFVRAPGDDAQRFSDAAKEKNLLLVPGGDFGCPDYFRICTCVSHDMILRSLPSFKELIAEFA